MLFRRLFLCALLVGVASGLLHAALQRLQVVPLIAAAEVHESAASPAAPPHASHHDAAPAPAAAHEHTHERPHESIHVHEDAGAHEHTHTHSHDADEWQPADGLERTVWTIVANILAATGYALLMIPMLALWDRSRGGTAASWKTGLAWGACAWLATFALPGIGLPPELPGMEAAELRSRQAWWLLCVVCSGAGLAAWLLARRHVWAWRGIGAVLLALPFAVGAPQPDGDALAAFSGDAAVQMHLLWAQFIWATALATALYWLALGALSAVAVARWVRPLTRPGTLGGATLTPAMERAL
ncbi:CbtA family protein [Ideonella sp. DXS29W]|uniref:CbtA family protein n=1 Tax=Ideonella lacteola TaxID=2984193 RepID=A0ABU9BJ32_9BURK